MIESFLPSSVCPYADMNDCPSITDTLIKGEGSLLGFLEQLLVSLSKRDGGGSCNPDGPIDDRVDLKDAACALLAGSVSRRSLISSLQSR